MRRDIDKLQEWRRRSAGLARQTPLQRTGNLSSRRELRTEKPLPVRPQPTTGIRLWIRQTQTCCVPGCGRGNPDPHHVRARGMGRSACAWADDVQNVVPLCRDHHLLGNSPGWSWIRFEAEVMGGILLVSVAERTWDLFHRLPVEWRRIWDARAIERNHDRGVPELRAVPACQRGTP